MLSSLNTQQRDAVQYCSTDCLLLAGAGSGKTKTLTTKVQYLLEQGVPASQILLLTFTNRAAQEMLERISEYIAEDSSQLEAGTFHKYCLRRLRQSPQFFQRSSSTIMDSADQLQLIRIIATNYQSDELKLPKANEILGIISAARNRQISIHQYSTLFRGGETAVTDALAFIAHEYSQQKIDRGLLDFDDLLEVYLTLLQKEPTFRNIEKKRFQYILVDEMQDTNPVQWQILKELHQPAKLFVVGDDAQSIYAFRGADFQNVHLFQKRVKNGTIKYLNTNYRSTQEILDISNWLLKNSAIEYKKYLTAAKPSCQQKPIFFKAYSEWDEAEFILQQLKAALCSNTPLTEILILARAAYLFRPIEALLTEARIPYRLVGGKSLFESAHIKDLLSVIQLQLTPTHDLSWMRFLMLWPKIGEKSALKAVSKLQHIKKLDESLKILRQCFPKHSELHQFLSELTNISDKPGECLHATQQLLEPVLSKQTVYRKNWSKRKKDFPTLQKTAERHNTLAAFLDAIALEPPEHSDDLPNAITLSTIHSAKGTEAEICFIIQVQPGQYPHSRSLHDEDLVEEERRLLYVALTRAKTFLYLTGLDNAMQIPFFFDNVPKELFDWY